jgi:osmotically-inducible protein OsmY
MPLALLSWDETRRSEMKIFIVLLFSVLLIAGCSKDRSDDKQVSQTNVEPDNSVKIITSDGTVTLRGPVKSDKERAEIEAKAKQVSGVKRVENQLEIAS